MIIRKNNSPNLSEVEDKILKLRQMLESKTPSISEKKIDELILFMLNQNYTK